MREVSFLSSVKCLLFFAERGRDSSGEVPNGHTRVLVRRNTGSNVGKVGRSMSCFLVDTKEVQGVSLFPDLNSVNTGHNARRQNSHSGCSDLPERNSTQSTMYDNFAGIFD